MKVVISGSFKKSFTEIIESKEQKVKQRKTTNK